VVWRRYRQIGFGAELILVVDQRGVILGEEQFADSVLKRNCPVIRLGRVTSPSIRMQIVYDVATAEDENAFFSQLRQAFTDLVVKRGRLGFIR